jgi:hypothetical protein
MFPYLPMQQVISLFFKECNAGCLQEMHLFLYSLAFLSDLEVT